MKKGKKKEEKNPHQNTIDSKHCLKCLSNNVMFFFDLDLNVLIVGSNKILKKKCPYPPELI